MIDHHPSMWIVYLDQSQPCVQCSAIAAIFTLWRPHTIDWLTPMWVCKWADSECSWKTKEKRKADPVVRWSTCSAWDLHIRLNVSIRCCRCCCCHLKRSETWAIAEPRCSHGELHKTPHITFPALMGPRIPAVAPFRPDLASYCSTAVRTPPLQPVPTPSQSIHDGALRLRHKLVLGPKRERNKKGPNGIKQNTKYSQEEAHWNYRREKQ